MSGGSPFPLHASINAPSMVPSMVPSMMQTGDIGTDVEDVQYFNDNNNKSSTGIPHTPYDHSSHPSDGVPDPLTVHLRGLITYYMSVYDDKTAHFYSEMLVSHNPSCSNYVLAARAFMQSHEWRTALELAIEAIRVGTAADSQAGDGAAEGAANDDDNDNDNDPNNKPLPVPASPTSATATAHYLSAVCNLRLRSYRSVLPSCPPT
eukprot:CAMPEP_0182473782 /NCGR_PEP_ID=MMETSP1319-20130603/24560_1 /TAXON_ID=172717 /ORGANISM="Bolidomonas pacifica, Strain RCC208" /LENGTH=205 /DNA_ID=CAMNT_0024674615 /DNA_START=118 /DNA_END=731 /DNA_ORIENTATION=+